MNGTGRFVIWTTLFCTMLFCSEKAFPGDAPRSARIVARNDFELSPRWRHRTICGKDFYFIMPHDRMDLFKKAGIDQEPFVKESVRSIGCRAAQEAIGNPEQSELYKELLALPNPITIWSVYWPIDLEEGAYRRFEKDFGERFIGIGKLGEWGGHFFGTRAYPQKYRKWSEQYGTKAIPQTVKETYDVFRVRYQKMTQKPRHRSLVHTAAARHTGSCS